MARWKLANAHYLNIEGNKWEYQEVSRTTGKTIRVQMPVPTYLNPNDPADLNYKTGRAGDEEGEIIVAHGTGMHEPKDYIFVGDPTPDMIPLDDEAKALSVSFEEQWKYKPETDPGNFSQSLVDQFQLSMAEVSSKPAQIEGMAELITAMSEMAKTNQEVIKSLVRRA